MRIRRLNALSAFSRFISTKSFLLGSVSMTMPALILTSSTPAWVCSRIS